jgi:hypothetical protein
MAARGSDLARDINTMLVVLQAMIDEHDAVMAGRRRQVREIILGRSQFWRGAREPCNLRNEFSALCLHAP